MTSRCGSAAERRRKSIHCLFIEWTEIGTDPLSPRPSRPRDCPDFRVPLIKEIFAFLNTIFRTRNHPLQTEKEKKKQGESRSENLPC